MERQYEVYLGFKASIWSHRGYRVESGSVFCDSLADAQKVVRDSLGDNLYGVEVDEAIYLYGSRLQALVDDEGTNADAVVRPLTNDGQ